MANLYSDTLGTLSGTFTTSELQVSKNVPGGFIFVVRDMFVWIQRIVDTDQLQLTVQGEGPGGLIIYDSVPLLTNRLVAHIECRICLTNSGSQILAEITSDMGMGITVLLNGYKLTAP